MDRIIKRAFDLVVTVPLTILISPVLGLIALLVKSSSPGPVFYRQERLGRDNRVFEMLKFRTMRTNAESDSGPVWTVENDPRRTRIGSFLRRFSLDELPQVFNVIHGEMSLVGPRPEREVFAAQFHEEIPRYLERHRVRSGITGWAQVHGLRGNTPIEVRTLYDLYYVENWSVALDLRILLQTVIHVLRGENAY
jgi:exopolysaccharide biosynthesis polyprenyl glycosylphosphotransferase